MYYWECPYQAEILLSMLLPTSRCIVLLSTSRACRGRWSVTSGVGRRGWRWDAASLWRSVGRVNASTTEIIIICRLRSRLDLYSVRITRTRDSFWPIETKHFMRVLDGTYAQADSNTSSHYYIILSIRPNKWLQHGYSLYNFLSDLQRFPDSPAIRAVTYWRLNTEIV